MLAVDGKLLIRTIDSLFTYAVSEKKYNNIQLEDQIKNVAMFTYSRFKKLKIVALIDGRIKTDEDSHSVKYSTDRSVFEMSFR